MPQAPDWKRALETGANFTEVRRSQAHRIASDLVSQGQIARDQIGAAVDEIVETSRRRSEEFRQVVRAEVQRQLQLLGLAKEAEPKLRTGSVQKAGPATKAAKRAPAKKKAATKKAPAKKSPAKAAAKPAKKAAKKSGATKKATAKKATAKKATAKKAPAKKSQAKRAG